MAFHSRGFKGKSVRMSVRLAVALMDMAEEMKSHLPEEDYEAHSEAIMWIQEQVQKRYTQAERAAWRAGRK